MRKHKNLLTADEIIRRNWIYELQANGVASGPNGKPFEEVGYYEIRNLVIMQEIRKGN